VLGLTRSDAGAQSLVATGVEAGGRSLSGGGGRSFWLARRLCRPRFSGFKRANPGTARMAPGRSRLVADLERMRY
jgi:hypothetical protein